MDPPFKGIIYVSTLRKNITLEDIQFLSKNFSTNNKKHDISGVLVCASGTVMQYIEGEKEKIDRLYLNILNDNRHYNIITLFEEEIETKFYEDWGLKFEKSDIAKLVDIKQQLSKKQNVLAIFNSFIRVNIQYS